MSAFIHPVNGHREEVSGLTWLWAFLFGIFYFMYRGVWRHVLIQFVLTAVLFAALGPPAFMFLFVMWVSYAFMARSIMESSYLRAGYRAADSVDKPANTGPKQTAQEPTDQHLVQALAEAESTERDAGLWARVFVQAGGDESKAKAAYAATRAQQIAEAAFQAQRPTYWASNEPLPQRPPP